MAACGVFLKRLPSKVLRNSKTVCFRQRFLRFSNSGQELSVQAPSKAQDEEQEPSLVSDKTTQDRDFSTSPLNRNRNKNFTDLMNYRYMYPEFLPDSSLEYRHHVREKLERLDMLRRRQVLDIPEFYVGSVLAVTASDEFAPGKHNRFVGICIMRAERGTRTNFTLRNIVDRQGVEISYDLYNPCILKIEVLRLEKRLDDHLLYLRDADPELSTFPFDMEAEHHPENLPVPVNTTKVKLRPPPWFARWELWNLEGVDLQGIELPDWRWESKEKTDRPWTKWDLMADYRKSIHEEDQIEIWKEVETHHQEMKVVRKSDRRRSLRQKNQK